jgi:hypothetical protein
MKTLLWLWFVAIQLVSWLVLFPLGLVLLLPLAGLKLWVERPSTAYPTHSVLAWRGGWATWLWGNEENGVLCDARKRAQFPVDDRVCAYVWSALRNNVNNLRFVPGVSVAGGPFYRYVRGALYFQCGFRPDTAWPVISAGKIRGPFGY